MADPTAALKATVGRLMQDAQSLQQLFLTIYARGDNEANRKQLQSACENEGARIKTNLYTLISRTPLKPALETPNSAYNLFISTWDNGKGQLLPSFNRITEFWTSLRNAQPALDRLMVPQPVPGQPGPWTRGGVGRTPAEIQILTTLRSQTDELWQVYTSCVATHTAAAVQKTKEPVRVIGELLYDTRLSRQAQTVLTNAKPEWQKFISQYKNGNGIDKSSWNQLLRFQTVLDRDIGRYLAS
jgi:hypothetical protein